MNKISLDIIKKIKELHQEGLSNRKIAKAVEIDTSTVARQLKNIGLETNFKHTKITPYIIECMVLLHQKGLSNTQIAEDLKLSIDATADRLRELGLFPNIQHPSPDREKIEQIKILHSQGESNRKIAIKIGIDPSTVAKYMNMFGLISNISMRYSQPIELVSPIEARCSKCDKIKPLNEFQFGRKGTKYEYKFSYCNECRRKQTYLNLNNDINKFLADRYNRMIRRAKKYNIPYNITKEQFIAQFNEQDGLCFYTDVELIWKVGQKNARNASSIDKIIPELGYVFGNVVFATNRINTCKSDLTLDEIKQWMPTWYERIQKFLDAHKNTQQDQQLK